MTETASSKISQTALLILPDKLDCYEKNLAGVPFLLRNILTLQRAGIEKLVLWLQDHDKEPLHHQTAQDPRVELEIVWANTGKPFADPAWVIDGSTLLDKQALITAMALAKPDPAGMARFLYFPEILLNIPSLTVLSPQESSRLTYAEGFRAAEERLLKSAGLSNDSFMDKMVTRFISRQLTCLFLNTSLTPNQITGISLCIGLASALSFYQGSYYSGLAGALLLLVSAWVDCADGEIARLKFMETPWGAKFDILCDNIVHFAIFFSIGMGLYFSTGDPLYKVCGGLAVFGSLIAYLLLSGIIVQKKKAAEQGKTSTSNLADQLANRDFTYFLLAMAGIGRLDLFIILTAVGANIFALYLIYQKYWQQ